MSEMARPGEPRRRAQPVVFVVRDGNDSRGGGTAVNETTRAWVYWTPRILCLAFAAFLGVFALDVFSMSLGFWHTGLALLMHLIPSGIVLIALVVVWRREWIGAVLFPLLAAYHLVTKWGQLDWSGYAVIDGPLLLLGVLFWLSWRSRATFKPSTG